MITKKHHYMETWQRKATGHGGCYIVENSQHLATWVSTSSHTIRPGPIRDLMPIALEMKRRMEANAAVQEAKRTHDLRTYKHKHATVTIR